MVKGVTRRVIVVKSPDRRLFEQAIFIVREEAFAAQGVTAQQVLEEAHPPQHRPRPVAAQNSRPGLRPGRGKRGYARLGAGAVFITEWKEGNISLFTILGKQRQDRRRFKKIRCFCCQMKPEDAFA